MEDDSIDMEDDSNEMGYLVTVVPLSADLKPFFHMGPPETTQKR
jgi:hypothetical protein